MEPANQVAFNLPRCRQFTPRARRRPTTIIILRIFRMIRGGTLLAFSFVMAGTLKGRIRNQIRILDAPKTATYPRQVSRI